MAGPSNEFVYRNRYFLLTDLILFILSVVLSYSIRLENFVPSEVAVGIACFLAFSFAIKLTIFLLSGVYSHYWRNAGPSELLLIGRSCLLAGVCTVALTLFLTSLFTYDQLPLPRSVAVIDFLLSTILVTVSRFSLRAVYHVRSNQRHRNRTGAYAEKRALIIGAGQTGIQVLDTIGQSVTSLTAVGFLDDNEGKVGNYVRGLKVLGKLADLPTFVAELNVNLVIIAMPSASGSVIRQIVQVCHDLGIEHQIVPGLYELLTGKVSISALRPIAIDDLLRRAPVQLDVRDIQDRLRAHCVMVTGAGGSIGSELARQIARCAPSHLLLVGHGENSLFLIEQRLKSEFPGVPCETLLVDIQDRAHLEQCFERWQPEIVFHAAAHKHVPLLESNVNAAILNNIVGTRNVIDLCNRYQVTRMVLISTDKAVLPTSVMGMSKRVAELLILQAAQQSPGRFAAVRFGNVLGSRGSVVPIFQQQIANGGPVTITSDKMTRFFMSVSEAVLLVLKASALTDYGPLFVLNMGDPVLILDLARDLIKLNGLEPDRDIEIRAMGVRPGEKLYEELFWDFEKRFLIEQGSIYALQLPDDLTRQVAASLPDHLVELIELAESGDKHDAYERLKALAFLLPTRSNVPQLAYAAEKNSVKAAPRIEKNGAKPATGTI